MKKEMNKKGAIELSITTIIVIVLGVTLLVLGLVFVQGIFSKVTELSDAAFRDADREIKERIGANQKVYVSGVTFELDPGKSTTINIGVQNFGTETTSSIFTLQVVSGTKVVSGPKVGGDIWFLANNAGIAVNVGEKKGLPTLLQLPKGVEPGSSYTFTLNVYKGREVYGSEAILVKVKE